MEEETTLAAPRPSGSAHPTTNDLRAVQRRFEVLQGQLELLDSLGAKILGSREWSGDLEGRWEKERNIILAEMTALAWRAERARAEHADDYHAKAYILLDILLDWYGPEDADIGHCLAVSLCKDLCRIDPVERPKVRVKSVSNPVGRPHFGSEESGIPRNAGSNIRST